MSDKSRAGQDGPRRNRPPGGVDIPILYRVLRRLFKMKKYLAMLLAGALSVSLLAGCGGSNGSDSAASNAGSASNGSDDDVVDAEVVDDDKDNK